MKTFRILLFGVWLLPCCAFSRIDGNGNDMSDVWEAAYGPGLAQGVDSDGDGFSNAQEEVSGTNPHDSRDHPRIASLVVEPGGEIVQRWPTVAGVRYRVLASTDLLQWVQVGAPVIGTGAEHEAHFLPDARIANGEATRSRWENLSGGDLSLIKGYAAQGSPVPSLVAPISLLDIPQGNPNLENYGQWIRGWLVAPQTGNYTFWIAGDDGCELWVSTDETTQAVSLASSVGDWTNYLQWTKYPSQKSGPRALTAGRSYYFEVFHREGYSGDHLSVAWTRPGMADGTRELIDGSHLSSIGQSLAEFSSGGRGLYFRLQLDQADSDADGVTDYEERLLGLNPALATSTPRVADLAAAGQILASPSAVTLGVAEPRAYEADGTAARFVVFRAGGIGPLTVPYSLSGDALPGVDYETLTGSVSIGPGVRSVEIEVRPTADGLLEPQETVTMTLLPGVGYDLGSPGTASVAIDDAADVLFVAQLRPGVGVESAAAGTAAVRRSGNALTGRASLSFSGLGSAQTGAEIYVSDDGAAGPVVFSHPLNQVPALVWNFDPAGGLSREEIIGALDQGRLWVRVLSADFPAGEIKGRLAATPGWDQMPAPEPPPAAPLAAEDTGDAARFLTQATFGPTEAELVALGTSPFAAWIDAQLAMPASHHLPYVQSRRAELMARDGNDGWQGPRNEAWWQHALTAPDQLRQRMAFALSQIFVVSQFGALDIYHEGITQYYDMLLDQAFGNYRDLLEEVTLSPMMGTYLSMMRNQKPDPVTGHEPDENYAREIMQLMSVGLNMMHQDGSLKLDAEGMPIPTYTQNDIVGLAHIFTGWGPHYDDADPPMWGNPLVVADRDGWFRYGYDAMRPMTMNANFHDTQERVILGGAVIPAGTDGLARLDQALDVVFQHPNVGPFMARQLIQRFVTSNPSPGYVFRVAGVFNDNGSGVRGDLGATIRAVLTDYEARHPAAALSASYGKPSEPLLRATRMLRVLGMQPPVSGDSRFFLNTQWSLPEQAPLLSPSVFNFFQPGYSNPGNIARTGLLSPEFQIFSETTAIRQANLHFDALNWGIWTSEPDPGGGNAVLRFNLQPLAALLDTPGLTVLEAQDLLIDHLSDRLLSGEMSPGLRADIKAGLASLPGWFDYTPERQISRVRMALYLIMTSPGFFVQR